MTEAELLPRLETSPLPGAGRSPVAGRRAALWTRWAPAAALVACVGAVCGRYGVALSDLALFVLYVALGLTLPGLLWIRALHRREHPFPEELALGVALGYALEVLAYIPARAIGAPLLVVAWPLGTYALFLAVPGLRGHWRGRPRTGRAPGWWPWSLTLIVICLILWTAAEFFGTHALIWPAMASSYVDMPYHLALIGEVKHHMPPTTPGVAGEPLAYHWFVHAHVAAASWVTGLEPLVLLYRLAVLPMLAALAVLLGAVGRRVTGSWAGGLAALAGTVFVAAPTLYSGAVASIFSWAPVQSWASPSQVFCALLFAPVVLLVIDLVDGSGPARGHWVLLAIMMSAVAGAKATYLPLLAVGLMAVVVVETVRWRRLPRRALAVLGLALTGLALSNVLLYGGARQGLVLDPLSIVRVTWRNLTGAGSSAQVPWFAVLGIAGLCLLCGAITWCGVLGLAVRPRELLRTPVVLGLGMGLAGLAAFLLLGHPGLSQGYFLQAAYPYLAMVAVSGTALAIREAGLTVRSIVCAGGVGVLTATAIRLLFDVRIPLRQGQSDLALYLPYLALLGVVVLVVAARRGGRRTLALTICLVTAAGTPAAWLARTPPDSYDGASAQDVPSGLLAAGRWLRDHSAPDDIVATNTHCRLGYENPCDSRAYWTAALTERRVLVEGWAYAARNTDGWSPGEAMAGRPFWDRERIRANDAVFEHPSKEAVRLLRDRYGVRWLLADERRSAPGSALGSFASPRFRSGGFGVYQVGQPARR
ncbi:hypothetical protein [Nonomuraea sp. NPDC049784]|uniref:hypothetical protein n=1 Tax=Nonomuraea sp. NPDC049784 TaxID=3154361 RepID=UPI0033FAB3B1